MNYTPGSLVSVRNRDWVVLPSENPDIVRIKPLGGSDDEITGIYLPLKFPEDAVRPARFPYPAAEDIGDFQSAGILHDAARLSFRNGAGPFRCLARLSFRPRAYQMVPLIMALRLDTVRMLLADDVGIGKTIEALLIVRELLERRIIRRFAVICLPHLCEQWQAEIRDKIGLDAVIIRSNTQARLDREIPGDTSVYEYYPFQVISVDFIKSDSRRTVFVEQCPEMIIVDEAHSCARPAGAQPSQQQRFFLLNKIAQKPDKHLVLLTATPHSGKPEEFQSLLGLIKPEFERTDLQNATGNDRKELARYFVQRRRADIGKWMGESTPFPHRDAGEFDYSLSGAYLQLFNEILAFARGLIADHDLADQYRRVHYWTALGLIRGVMSSPAAGVDMLKNRIRNMVGDTPGPDMQESLFENGESLQASGDLMNPVMDRNFGIEDDFTPELMIERVHWNDSQVRKLKKLTETLETLGQIDLDQKAAHAELIIDDWLSSGFHPVVFCRYIATANYLGDLLRPLLAGKHKGLDLQVVTSEDPDEVRKSRVETMASSRLRLLIATDCLSEGINLQDSFTAVLHYDLPWNPNRLEQREGRVDRFGQRAPVVKTFLLYGRDNPMDGIVLDVILRKVREIRKSIGITMPFPDDSQTILDTVLQSVLLNPKRIEERRQLEIRFDESDAMAMTKLGLTRRIDEAARRELASRSLFAQHAIKAQEIETDLKDMDDAIGDPAAVERFVTSSLHIVFGVQISPDKNGYRLFTANLPDILKSLFPTEPMIKVSFESPTPEGYVYLGRNHLFVEQICQMVLERSLHHDGVTGVAGAARASVVRCAGVDTRTTLLLFRVRNVIGEKESNLRIVAEEMLLWGYRGSPEDADFIDSATARTLLNTVQVTASISPQARISFLNEALSALGSLENTFNRVAEERSVNLVEAHERFSRLIDKKRFRVVYPVLPMDVLGIYILLPE